VDAVLIDLADEHASLDRLVADLPSESWDLPTPAEPWTIRDQISHLAFFDEQAALSVADPDAFMRGVNEALAQGVEAYMSHHLDKGRSMAPADLLAWWRTARTDLLAAFRAADPDERVPWYGPPMRARSSAVARLMETWAHGTDVADALRVHRPPTDRLFHIAELGVKTFRFSFENRGQTAPIERVRVELIGPSGTTSTWNDDADSSIIGPVEDFCMVVAQRRHLEDTDIVVTGETATRWMEIAQVFAGPPGPGRAPTAATSREPRATGGDSAGGTNEKARGS
jgi:uncharacterized protein (TIGR03084 family)